MSNGLRRCFSLRTSGKGEAPSNQGLCSSATVAESGFKRKVRCAGKCLNQIPMEFQASRLVHSCRHT